jgi:hypothetical protein
MSLIKSYLLSIEEMGYNPYKLNELSSVEWDNLLTKAMKQDSKLYGTLIWTRCKLKGEKYFKERAI